MSLVRGGHHLLPAVLFLSSFAWSFVFVSLPFHIQRISTLDEAATLRWTGWILGITSLVTVATSPLWGRLADRGNPRTLYMVIEVLQGVGFLGMAAARTLAELFLSRMALGLMGASSTFAFIMAGRAPDLAAMRRNVAAVQSAMTVGQVIGPLAGAVAAARLGFRPSFALGGVILFGCAALVWRVIPAPAMAPRSRAGAGTARAVDVAAVATIVLGGSTQVFFLTAVLPQILPPLGVTPGETLEIGGMLIFASGAAAALGAIAAPRVAEMFSERRSIAFLLLTSSGFLGALGLVSSVWLYGVLRFLQVLFVAPVFPIVVARIAQRAGGQAINAINAARVGAAFVGPVLATTVLAWTSPLGLHLTLALVGVACVPAVLREPAPARALG